VLDIIVLSRQIQGLRTGGLVCLKIFNWSIDDEKSAKKKLSANRRQGEPHRQPMGDKENRIDLPNLSKKCQAFSIQFSKVRGSVNVRYKTL
jgi:hypothetical protein